jgi:SAM-dependent methyltransferase
MVASDWSEHLLARLTPDALGIRSIPGTPEVSYPAEGNAECFRLEDTSFWFRHRNRAITTLLQRFPPAATPLLDVGGGNGAVAAALEATGTPVVLVEPGIEGVRNAAARGLRRVVRGTVEALGLPEHSVPAAGMFDVLEHIERDVDFLQQLRGLLCPDGRLYLTVPAFRWLWSLDDEAAGHFRRYTRASLTATLRAAGFEPEFVSYLFAPLPAPLFAMRTLPSVIGRRRVASQEQEHRSGGGILEALLRRELDRLRSGRSIPIGTSVVGVARVARAA